MRQCKKML